MAWLGASCQLMGIYPAATGPIVVIATGVELCVKVGVTVGVGAGVVVGVGFGVGVLPPFNDSTKPCMATVVADHGGGAGAAAALAYIIFPLTVGGLLVLNGSKTDTWVGPAIRLSLIYHGTLVGVAPLLPVLQ